MSLENKIEKTRVPLWNNEGFRNLMMIVICMSVLGVMVITATEAARLSKQLAAEKADHNETLLSLDAEILKLESAYSGSLSKLNEAELQIAKLSKQLNHDNKPFKPKFELSTEQNKLCLAIGTFTEVNGESDEAMETIAWGIMNRVIDPRGGYTYANNACQVLVAAKQYSGMGPYIVDIKDVVWGRINEFTPALAKKNEQEMEAWNKILKMTSDLIDGKLTRKTTADHFISFRSMATNQFPDWVRWLMPVGTITESGLHTLYRSWGYDRETGERVNFTKANPYNPKKHRA